MTVTMHGEVVRTSWLTPGLVRVVLGGGGLDSFVMPDATDAYVNLAFPPPGATYGPVFDPRSVAQTQVRESWPARRRYTVRAWDPIAKELSIDFVVHGEVGAAGRWAAHARPGDVLVFEGPAGGYRPDPTADWHLLVGDESALPAIAAALESLPPGAPAVVRLVCDGPDHEIALGTTGALDIAWLHRDDVPADVGLLARAVGDLIFHRGRVHAFVHGEADEIRAVRRHLLVDRALTRAHMSCSPYWRRTMTDEAWRAVKSDYVAQMESETGVR